MRYSSVIWNLMKPLFYILWSRAYINDTKCTVNPVPSFFPGPLQIQSGTQGERNVCKLKPRPAVYSFQRIDERFAVCRPVEQKLPLWLGYSNIIKLGPLFYYTSESLYGRYLSLPFVFVIKGIKMTLSVSCLMWCLVPSLRTVSHGCVSCRCWLASGTLAAQNTFL